MKGKKKYLYVIKAICFFFFSIVIWTTPLIAKEENPVGSYPSSSHINHNTASPENYIESQIDLNEMRSFLEQLDQDLQNSLPNFSLSRLFEQLKEGNLSFDPEHIGKGLLSFLGREILHTAPLIGKLLILAVLCALLQQLQNAYSGEVGKLAQMMAYLVLLGIALTSFQAAVETAKEALDQMVGLVQTSFPVLFTLLVAMGNITSAALLKPIVLGSISVLVTVLKNVVLPLFFLGAVLKIFNQISSQFQLKKLAGLFEFAGKMGLGLVLTCFLGVMAIQGVTGGVADSVTLRAAKYSADLIPVVGKFFKDAVELVVSSGLVLKNAIGLIAICAIAMICIGPIVKIIAMVFIFRISAALIEPLGQSELADSLQTMSQSLINIFAVVASVAIMFFITVSIIVGVGNLTVMMR